MDRRIEAAVVNPTYLSGPRNTEEKIADFIGPIRSVGTTPIRGDRGPSVIEEFVKAFARAIHCGSTGHF